MAWGRRSVIGVYRGRCNSSIRCIYVGVVILYKCSSIIRVAVYIGVGVVLLCIGVGVYLCHSIICRSSSGGVVEGNGHMYIRICTRICVIGI
jgi:hypothetical protein